MKHAEECLVQSQFHICSLKSLLPEDTENTQYAMHIRSYILECRDVLRAAKWIIEYAERTAPSVEVAGHMRRVLVDDTKSHQHQVSLGSSTQGCATPLENKKKQREQNANGVRRISCSPPSAMRLRTPRKAEKVSPTALRSHCAMGNGSSSSRLLFSSYLQGGSGCGGNTKTNFLGTGALSSRMPEKAKVSTPAQGRVRCAPGQTLPPSFYRGWSPLSTPRVGNSARRPGSSISNSHTKLGEKRHVLALKTMAAL